jgi:predicted dehydrogenase
MLVRDRAGAGIIGCGGVTRATIDSFLDSGGSVAWVMDPDAAAREAVVEQVARRAPAPLSFDRVEDALRRGGDDAPVLINSPGSLHLAHVALCAEAGRPMLVAKPLGMDWEETERALRLADEARVSLEVAEQYPDETHALQISALLDRYGPARRILLDHRKPSSSQGTLEDKRQTGILEYAVHHYAVLSSWLGVLPRAIAVDSWTANGGRNGTDSIGHAWLHYDSCHVLHAFGFGGERAIYRAEIETDSAVITATGQHFAAPDVEVTVVADGESIPMTPRRAAARAWDRMFVRWLDSSATEVDGSSRRRIRIVAAMVDAALRAADTGAVVDLRADPRFEDLW